MSWQDRMRPASFRGVPFFVDGSTNEFGRRLQRDELVGIPRSQYTDFDLDDDVYEVDAFLFGDDYDQIRDDLKAALLTKGPGNLVFGTKGTIRARIVERPRIVEHRGALGYCVVSFTAVYEPESTIAPSQALAGKLSAASLAMQAAVTASAVSTYDVDGLPDSQFGNITSALNNATSALRRVNGRVSSALGVIDTVSLSIDQFSEQINTLISTPSSLVSSLTGVVYGITGLVRDVVTGIDQATGLPQVLARANPFEASLPARAMVSHIAGLTAVGTASDPQRVAAGTTETIEPTPDDAITLTRQQEARAAHTVYVMTRAAALAGLAEQAATMEIESATQADQLIAILSDGVDTLITAPTGTATNELIQAAEDMRAAAFRHLRDVSRGLGAVRTYSPRAEVPMVLVAQEVYGDVVRENEIIARNRHPHPLFVERSDELEVIL